MSTKGKKVRNLSRKYGSALTGIPKTEYKDLLYQDKNNKLKKINALDVTHNGSSFGLILGLYEDLKELHKQEKKEVGHSISTLISLLKFKGYNTPNVELNALIEDINHLLIIEPDKEYFGFKLTNGYVSGYGYDVIMVKQDIPEDFDKGYWKIIDYKFVLDEEKYELMWRSL
jgi:hypothetical protein